MGFFDSLFGTGQQARPPQPRNSDEVAVERYRYLLRTAPPEAIEQVHVEAFAKLTEDQRTLLFNQLTESAPVGEAPRDTSPSALASSATRQELRNPGTMERSFGGAGFGSSFGGSLMGTIVGYVVASAIVSSLMPMDYGSDAGATDAGGSDAGGDYGGGGDFGGGDFGGGDFGF